MANRIGVLLTKRIVDAADPREDRYHLWDSLLPGFGLRVEKSGAKTFIVRYRADGGGRTAAQRFVTIGRYGPLTPEQARKLAKTVLGGVARGEDPADERRAKRAEMRMGGLIDLYEEEGCFVQRGKRRGAPMKPLTRQFTVGRLRNHVVPLLGHKRITEINPGDIERFARDVAAGKTARDEKIGPRKRLIVRGGEGIAAKVVRDLSAVFSFAMRREIVSRNPCQTAAVRKTGGARERFLTLEEVSRLRAALDELERDGANPKALNIARLWALTGCRRNEITGLKWSEVNLAEGLLVLDDSKTGKSIRPLGAAAIAIFESIDRREGTAFVFPAERGDGHFQGMKRIWSKVMPEGTARRRHAPHPAAHDGLNRGLERRSLGLDRCNPRAFEPPIDSRLRPCPDRSLRAGRPIAWLGGSRRHWRGTRPMPGGRKEKPAVGAGRSVRGTCFG
jgi:integrase